MILMTTLLPLLVLLSLRAGECATGPVNFVVSTNEDVAKPYIREKRDAEDKPPIITEMNINSNVSNRFATTLIESKVKNAHTKAREATFSVILPEQAFISEFVMIIDGKSYKAYVKEKEEAKNIYDKAVSSGQSAAHVAVSARDSNRFTVSVNVEPEAKATFLLTYEELLERKNEQYELVLNINPGQIVKNLNVQVNVNESRPLTFVKTPALRSGNEISKKDDKLTPLSIIERISPTNTIVKFKPTIEQQKEYAKELGGKDDEGFSGQFVVQYEVERDPSGGEILLKDGYFVHFFAPKDTESLPKNVYFILDTSSSMFGTKIQQLKDAMMSILQEIKPVDTLSIVEFNSGTFAWNIEAEKSVEVNFSNYTQPFEELSKNDLPGPVEATKEIIEKAKKLVSNMRAIGGTYMIGGLETGLYMVKSEIDRAKGTTNKRQPMIVFLTDGQPNIGTYSTEEITKHVTRLNSEGIEVPIFSLSFGQGADKAFLRRLSLKNSGFARHIYEASDASIQLQDFYKIISSPLLTDIHFKYDEEAKEITKIRHPIYFKGNEIAIAGRYTGPKLDVIVDAVGPKGPVVLKPTIEEPVTSLERLWAYLTIKQTLEKREVAENKTELTKKALDLALKYSFVTDVSSLVVVKPNATDDVNTEDASNNNPSPNFGYSNRLAFNHMANFRPAVQPLSVGDSGGPILIRGSDDTAKLGSAAFDSPVAFASAFIPPTTSGIPAYTTLTEKPSTSPSISELEKSLHWLSAALNANGTLLLPGGAFELGDSSLNLPVDGTCPATPKGEEGNCSLLKDCPAVFSLLTDFEVYKKFSCVVQNKYAGVCCPKAVPVPL